MKIPGLIITGMLLVPVTALAASAFDGTWKYNTATLHASKKAYVYVIEGGNYTCETCGPSYTVKADGTDQKVTGHDYDTSAVTLAANSVTIVTKLKGKTLSTGTFTASADGKTLAIEQTSNYGATPVVTKAAMMRTAAGAAGANPVSGSWTLSKIDSVSDSGTVETLGMTDDGFTFSANGQSYDAKFDDKKYPIAGDPTNTMVKLKKVSATEVIESDYDKGKLVETIQFTVAADGKHIRVVDSHLRTGRVSHYTLDKQP